jgi:hypothetical protein
VWSLKKRNGTKLLIFIACLLWGVFIWNNWVQPYNQTASAANDFSVDYSQYDWGSGAAVNVTITNKGSSPINDWTLGWQFSGDQKITNIWNATFKQSGASVTATNQSHNSTIPANGGKVSFGFIISYSGKNTKPASFTLNGNVTASPTAASTSTVATTATPAPTPTSSDSGNDWESNVGTITLGTTITYTGSGVSTNGSKITIAKGGDFTVTGTLANGQIYVDTTEKVKLRLSGVNITNSVGPAIYIGNAKKAFITLTEGTSNTLADGTTYTDSEAKGTIFSNDTLEIKGNGSLTVTGKYKHAIASDDDIIIENGNITITSAVKDGIHANNNVTVNGGTLKITATSDCIESEGDMVINDGTFTFAAGSDGVQTATDFTINGGTINVTKSVEGLESKANLIINNGTVNVVASDDGLNSKSGMAINGGTVTLAGSRGDGIDTAGPLKITGGNIVAYGTRAPEGSFDCDNNNFTVTGGTMIGLGGNTSGPTAGTCTQCVVVLRGISANQTVTIKKSDGTQILSFTAKQGGNTFVYSSPSLALNTTYTMYVNGTQTRTFTTTSRVTVSGGSIFNPGGGPMPPGPRPSSWW